MLTIVIILIVAAFGYLGWQVWGKNADTGIPGISGRVIWRDMGPDTKPFFNQEFKVFGKPDLICKSQREIISVEYKSRKKGFYASDIAQAKAGALAARGKGVRVNAVLLVNKTEQKKIQLNSSDQALYSEIETLVDLARRAKQGQALQATPNRFKCRSCGQRENCKHSSKEH